MRSPLRAAATALIPLLVVLACFTQLGGHPGWLIVDGARPSLDHASRPGSRGVGNDLTFFWLPKYDQVVGQVRADGRIPYWDTSGFGGRPFLGNPQAGRFYAPAWLAWRVARSSALGWVTVAHLAWAAIGTFLLVRALGMGRAACAVAAGCFAVSPYLVAHTFEGHYPHVWSASWYPWAFWTFLLTRRGKAGGMLALPVVLALSFLTGHAQEWYYLVIALSLWAAADAAGAWWHGRRREALTGLLIWAGLLALSLAVCAVELAPELVAQRWTLRRSSIPLRAINRYTVHTVNLFQLVSPFALGRPHDYFGHDNYWETLLSIGLVPLALAGLGAARHPDRRIRRGFLALVAFAVVFAVGRRLGLFAVAYRVLPGMDRFRVPSRSLFLASLGAAVLVGLGMDVLLCGGLAEQDWPPVRRRLRRWLVGLTVLLAVGGLVRLSGLVPTAPPAERADFEVAGEEAGGTESLWESRGVRAWCEVSGDLAVWGTVLGMLAIVSLARGDGRASRRAGLALGALALIELSVSAQRLLVVTPPGQLLANSELVAKLKESVSTTSGPVRVAASPRALSDLDAANAGIEKTNTNDSFQIQHAANLYERLYPYLDDVRRTVGPEQPMDQAVDRFHLEIARSVLDRMSVRWVATAHGTALDRAEGFRREAVAGPDLHLLRNLGALPRCYVVPQVEPLTTLTAPVHVILSRVDPRTAVVLGRDPLAPGDRQPFTPAEWRSDDPDRVVVRVETRAPGLLVVTNTWMPGWKARVDGRSESVLRGDFWQQTVPIRQAGRHEVVLSYDPPGRREGVAFTCVAAAAWVVLAGMLGWRAREGHV